ncbi:hypothetical protein WH221_21300 [Chryseobacterium culicis]|uniref:Uncharacterized protein n=1 Tax=Chryseobacterium culicis TaxID=680127 RepID=A0A2S9CJW3_CHRCI|nr:hypothetical protein [Chryseobacterium culicis]PRB80729.1 hypothetical protein CQ022_21240 [Chryseobacterium culicis]PRB87578.1 hypothetical protein CQ033_21245 [Chryseobacterium culicis]
MKKVIAGAFALSLCVVSCKKETKTESSTSTDTLATVMPKDSVSTPKNDSVAPPPPSATSARIITKNVGKYPHDIKFFEDKSITERLKKLVGTQYDEMVKNFNVESPVASENGIYKLTGCKQHDCPGYATNIYYDAKNDNLNVSIDKNGKITDFAEKGKIVVSEALKAK